MWNEYRARLSEGGGHRWIVSSISDWKAKLTPRLFTKDVKQFQCQPNILNTWNEPTLEKLMRKHKRKYQWMGVKKLLNFMVPISKSSVLVASATNETLVTAQVESCKMVEGDRISSTYFLILLRFFCTVTTNHRNADVIKYCNANETLWRASRLSNIAI